MDIVIDTNIIIQENFLRSKKSAALLDYLKKTNSRIALPQIVKEEAISQYEKSVTSQLDKTTNEIKKLSKICFSSVISTDLKVEVIKESTAYIGYIQKLVKDGLLYEIPYEDSFLHEVVFRMINRKKPCNERGEECRDAILWLSIKNMLKKEKSVAFISNNLNEFASLDKKDLHPDLRAELAQEKLELKYYTDLDSFIKNHTSKVGYITKEWIENELSKIDLIDIILSHFFVHEKTVFMQYEGLRGIDYVEPSEMNLSDFFVYEMMNGDIYLNLILSCSLEVIAAEGEIKSFVKEFQIRFSAKVIDKKISELEVERWNWTSITQVSIIEGKQVI